MTLWSSYRHYRCNRCGEVCINHFQTTAARQNFCHSCLSDIPDPLLPTTTDTSERVEGATPSHGGPTDRVSARDDRREDPSQRESPAEGPERGCGVRAKMTAGSSSESDE